MLGGRWGLVGNLHTVAAAPSVGTRNIGRETAVSCGEGNELFRWMYRDRGEGALVQRRGGGGDRELGAANFWGYDAYNA